MRYIVSVEELDCPDLIFLPGSKNTMGDLYWMRQNGLEDAVKKMAESIPVCGICGGYQMMGNEISDPEGLENKGTMKGMGLLPVATQLQHEKHRCQIQGIINKIEGIFLYCQGFHFMGMRYIWGKPWIFLKFRRIQGTKCHQTYV